MEMVHPAFTLTVSCSRPRIPRPSRRSRERLRWRSRLGKPVPLSIAVGVALAENVIQNDVQAYIAHANNLTTTGTGAISVLASETARIDSTTFAASAAIAVGKISFAAAVGVLEATNTLANNVAAYISDSGSIASAGAVTVSANDLRVISADTFSLAVAVGVIGVGVGTGSGNNTITDNVSAYVDNSMITTTAGDIIVTATSTPSITTTSTTVAVSLAIGAAVAVFDATTTVQGTTEAYLQNAVLTATGHAIEVTSTSTETLSPLVRGGAGGLIAVGVMLSEATVEGSDAGALGWPDDGDGRQPHGHGPRYQHGHASDERWQRRSGRGFARQDRCHAPAADRGIDSRECPNHPRFGIADRPSPVRVHGIHQQPVRRGWRYRRQQSRYQFDSQHRYSGHGSQWRGDPGSVCQYHGRCLNYRHFPESCHRQHGELRRRRRQCPEQHSHSHR